MGRKDSILIVEDDANLREALSETLQLANYSVLTAEDGESALRILESEPVSLIVSDVQMPGIDGHELLQTVRRQYTGIPFVLITAFSNVAKAVEAIKAGAADYIVKPFEAEVLIEMVNRLFPVRVDTGNMIIEDRKSWELARLAARVAVTDCTLMISGESGSGKEVYARYVHERSPRNKQPFCAINCAAIPEQMLESILFGYEKGAFTGAYTARAGKFEQANNGTLLLDEISEIDISLQAKLLRVIQEREVERLGGNVNIPLNVRLIATTNRDLKEEVKAGRFREDLYYRLNVFPLHLPPLRERPDDILPLACKFIERIQPGKGIQLSDESRQVLLAHRWGGNVRELENVIQRALIMKSGSVVLPEDIIFEEISQPALVHTVHATSSNAADLGEDLKTREKEIIIEAIARHSSRKEAAEKLGISPRTLRYKLAQFREEGMSIPNLANALRTS